MGLHCLIRWDAIYMSDVMRIVQTNAFDIDGKGAVFVDGIR